MGAITSLEHHSITVQPGGEATCPVLVRNTGKVVDQFTVEVLGDAKPWAHVEPAMVNLLPDEQSTVVVSFRPPRSSEVAAGPLPFGVRVNSREDPQGSVIEEGTLDIAEFTEIRAEIVPRRPKGRRQGKCEVAVDNLSNHPVAMELEAVDPDENLRFRPERTSLTLRPGTTAFIALVLRPDQGFLRGADKTYPFQVRATTPGAPPVVTEGAMVQQPLLPKWLPLALAALIALLIALVTLWLTVFKTTIQSTAREAAAKQVQQVAQTAKEAKAQADVAEKVASDVIPPRIGPHAPTPPPAGAPSGATPTPTSVSGLPAESSPATTTIGPSASGAPGKSEPIDFRIPSGTPAVKDKPGAAKTFVNFFDKKLPADKTILVSDLVLQNPFGDGGILRILREDPNGTPTTLLEIGLNNFRDIDYHWVQPLVFKPGEKIVLSVNCQTPGDGTQCNPSASFSGRSEG